MNETEGFIKPQITFQGYKNAVKDYNECAVIEELVANSYDEDATTALVLLNLRSNELIIVDDGLGFTKEKMEVAASLGGGDKSTRSFSNKKRYYLGSYGVGLKSTLNIASSIVIRSISKEGKFRTELNWAKLNDIINTNGHYVYWHRKVTGRTGSGAIITLKLKGSTDQSHLEKYGNVLKNLPSDQGNFKCYFGLYDGLSNDLENYEKRNFIGLKQIADKYFKSGKLQLATNVDDKDLEECEKKMVDNKDEDYKGVIYFTGLANDKTVPLKKSLRGIFVRIHGRLLKHDFTEGKLTYNISKFVKFQSGLRVELEIDWLRNQITLSRDGLSFTSEKLKGDFEKIIAREIGNFIRQKLDLIKKRKDKGEDKFFKTRIARVEQRVKGDKGVLIKGIKSGYRYIPETDAELAILLAAQPIMLKKIGPFELLDYNDQGSFDCVFYNTERKELTKVELEPVLETFLSHNVRTGIELIVTWKKGNWKLETLKKAKGGYLKLVNDKDKGNGCYKLLEFISEKSKNPNAEYSVVILEELLK